MAQPCRTCNHPDRERIEVELAMAPSVREGAERYDIPRRSLHRHRQEHMTAEQIIRIRGMTPKQAEVNIEELTRRGGESAVLGFTRLIQISEAAMTRCLENKMDAQAAVWARVQLDAYREQAKIAAIYPGKRGVTNNHLVLGDVTQILDFVDAALSAFPDAQRAVALAFARKSAIPALEHGS